ncbi:hypothetical protein QC764_506840 [Podospora pseudoanserina]|uniref:F-box domain-containing protein n=1 Tax=Podospora pseudoanserina TaxID=2609844 RepID=A0ABR0I934_9PEZI|nr:hypothetical protein QC764_506840 [Podospora pseudoanserina]
MTSPSATHRTQPKDTSILLSLPNETLLQIGGNLDEVAAASFSLASAHLYKLCAAYPASKWSTAASEVRHKTHPVNCGVDGHPDIIPQACERISRWEFLKLLEKDLKATHCLCVYCRTLHRLLPQPSLYKTACPWMALGPNYWNIGKLTFDDCYHALHDPDNPISSLRTSKTLGTQQYQVFLAWPVHSTSSKTITLPATKTAYHLPSLSFSSDWQPHPLSNSSLNSPYRHVHVKASLSAALVHLPSSINGIYSSFQHPNLLTFSTQRVFLPPEAFIPNQTNAEEEINPESFPTRHYLGFQICRHQPSYHPETINALLHRASRHGNLPRDILEHSLDTFYNNQMRCWRPPLKSSRDDNPNRNPNGPLRTSVHREQVCELCQTRYRAVVHTWSDPADITKPAAQEIVVRVWQNLGSFQGEVAHIEGNFPLAWFAPVGGKTMDDFEMMKGNFPGDSSRAPAFLGEWNPYWGKYWGSYQVADGEWASLYFGERFKDGIWGEFWWCEDGIGRNDRKDGSWKVLEGEWTRWEDLPGGKGKEGGGEEKGRGWLRWWG